MGALTDNRKRCFVDLCAPFSSSAVPTHLHQELPPAPGSPRKKLKVTPPPHPVGTPPPPPRPLQHRQTPSQPQSLPPPAPLRRPVHGPQRIVRVFGHGSSVGSDSSAELQLVGRNERLSGMGNLISWSINRAPLDALWSSHRKRKASVESGSGQRFGGENLGGLNLDEYKRLVESAQEGRSVATPERRSSGAKIALPQSVSPAVADLTIPAREVDELPKPHVLNRKAEDARTLVRVESTLPKEDLVEATRTPVYKDLLLSARKHDSRLSSLDFEVKLTEKKISDFQVKPEKNILGPFTPLTDAEDNDVNLALRDPDKFCLRKHEVLVLHESSNIEITREVIQCLKPGAWLNDEVINLYFELLKERERREPKKFLKCHFFNTFFYKKLTSGRNNYDFRAVKRWTTQRKLGYGLIECDKIFVPIHKEIHWCLAIIDVKEEVLLYLDSLGGMDVHVLRILARYFLDEVKDKSNKTIDVASWMLEQVSNLPLQKNGWDCGMFMLKYADFYSRGLSLCFQQDNMIYFRKRTAKEILRLKAE